MSLCSILIDSTIDEQGKGAPQLWLVGAAGEIVCVHSPQLTSVVLRSEGSDRKPDVTSFFDGFISSLPVCGVRMTASSNRTPQKSKSDHKALNSEVLQQLAVVPSTPSDAALAVSQHDTDIKQLKQVLETINTTKTMLKISLTKQVPHCLFVLLWHSVLHAHDVTLSSDYMLVWHICLSPTVGQERIWRRAFDFFDENKVI
jgi:hypothetical protein